MPEETATTANRPARMTREDLESLEKPEVITKYESLYEYLESLDSRKLEEELQASRDSEEKLKQQHTDAMKRESTLLKNLTEKEIEIAGLAHQIEELKQYQLPSNAQLRNGLLDPTVNVLFNRMKKELDNAKQRLEDSQNELNAWKFTQDSQTGKQLMARCRTLFKENEDLGKQISQGRIAKLEGEISLEKKLVDEMKNVQAETDEFVVELDDDMEGMQATIYLLQQQLKEVKDQLATSTKCVNITKAITGSQQMDTSMEHEDITPTEETPVANACSNTEKTTSINQKLIVHSMKGDKVTTNGNGQTHEAMEQDTDDISSSLTTKPCTDNLLTNGLAEQPVEEQE